MPLDVGVGHARVSRKRLKTFVLVKNVCLQEQRKQCFLTLAKENQSPLGLYRNPLTFFFTNPGFVLIIRDWCFLLFSPVFISLTKTMTKKFVDKLFSYD